MRLINVPPLGSKIGIKPKVQENTILIQTSEGSGITEFPINCNPETLGQLITEIILEAQWIGYINAQKDMRKALGILE